jgi:hypothetical protein
MELLKVDGACLPVLPGWAEGRNDSAYSAVLTARHAAVLPFHFIAGS